MFVNLGKYVINTDHVTYIEPQEHQVIVHVVGGDSLNIDKSWLTPEARDGLGLPQRSAGAPTGESGSV